MILKARHSCFPKDIFAICSAMMAANVIKKANSEDKESNGRSANTERPVA